MFVLADTENQGAVIKVIGVGGGGGNAVAHMVDAGIEGVDFICINTDAQALKHSKVKVGLQIGCNITKGLGAGADPEVGRQAAMEDRDRIIEMIEGSDMLFITAGMGGGTGTGAAPVVAQVAKELGILTVAVVTKPFDMEGSKRLARPSRASRELSKHVDSLITIPNQKLLTVLGGDVTLLDAFKAANQVLQGAVQGIAELITRPGMINVDFADVRTVMAETGMAMMGSGSARGENRAREAAEAAVSSPLLEDVNLSGRAWPADQRHGGHGPAHQRVQHGRRHGQAVRLRRRERGRGLRDRSGNARRDPRDRGRDRHRPSGGCRSAAAAGCAPHDGDRGRPWSRAGADAGRSARADLHPQPARSACAVQRRAVGDGLTCRGHVAAGYSGVPAPAGGLSGAAGCRSAVAGSERLPSELRRCRKSTGESEACRCMAAVLGSARRCAER